MAFNIFDPKWPVWDVIRRLKQYISENIESIDCWDYKKTELVGIQKYTFIDEGIIKIGDRWDENYTYFWTKQIKISPQFAGKDVYLYVDTEGEGEIFANDIPLGSIDTEHYDAVICRNAKAGEMINIKIEITKHIHNSYKKKRYSDEEYPHHVLNGIGLMSKNLDIATFHYLCDLLFQCVIYSTPEDRISDTIYSIMEKYLLAFDFTQSIQSMKQNIEDIRKSMVSDLKAAKLPVHFGKATYMCHSHLDLVFKWRWMETVRKIERTLSNVNTLLNQYPENTYIQSQMKILDELKDKNPSLFNDITALVKKNQIEVIGSIWAEYDTNLTGLESVVRHTLYGRKFSRENYDVESKTMFLPDTFGYSAALPQLFAKMGYEYFVTTKLYWNDTNKFPHTLFNWQGIDGTSVKSCLLPGGYGGYIDFGGFKGPWYNTHDHGIDNYPVMYGSADGGGGICEDMILKKRALKEMDILIDCNDGLLTPALDDMSQCLETFPVVEGELYLETHRGTYTSQSKIKKGNRKSETHMREAELLSAFAWLKGSAYPQKRLEDIWKKVLFNQFHDILPGSCTGKAAEDAVEQYADIAKSAKEITDENRANILGEAKDSNCIAVVNTLNWMRNEVCSITVKEACSYANISNIDELSISSADHKMIPFTVYCDDSGNENIVFIAKAIPAYGVQRYYLSGTSSGKTSVQPLSKSSVLKNTRYTVVFDNNGDISSIQDFAGTQLLNGTSNITTAYLDRAGYFNAWDINKKFRQFPNPFTLASMDIIEDTEIRSTMKVVKKMKNSTLTQYIHIYNDIDRIDFCSTMDVHDHEMIFKVTFDTGILSETAAYDLSAGYLRRNALSSHPEAASKHEVPMQKWFALTKADDSGIAVLNDCKYGGCTNDGVMELTVLKTGIFPDENQDMGETAYTYSLLPFTGEKGLKYVNQNAYELNNPAIISPSSNEDITCLFDMDADNIVVECIKRSESGDGIVIRMYEPAGVNTQASVTLPESMTKAYLTDPLEGNESPLSVTDRRVKIDFKPFKIITVVLK